MKKLLRISALLALLLFGSLNIGNTRHIVYIHSWEEMADGQFCTTMGLLCEGGGGTAVITCGTKDQIGEDMATIAHLIC